MSGLFERLQNAEREKAAAEKAKKPRLEIVSPAVPDTDDQPIITASDLEILADLHAGRLDAQKLDAQTPTPNAHSPERPDAQTPRRLDVQTPTEEIYPSRKHRKRKSLRLPAQKVEKYELFCFMNKIDFQDLVEKALDNFIGRPDAHILINDLDEEKETDEVLIFYRNWTRNKIKPKDRITREDVRKYSPEICKIGILTALQRATNRVNSFLYCATVIEDIAEQVEPIQDKGGYLQALEKFVLTVRKNK